jgi:hypothetical protein
MAYEGVDKGKIEIEEELRGIKRQRKLPDPEVDHFKMIIEELDLIIRNCEAEMH